MNKRLLLVSACALLFSGICGTVCIPVSAQMEVVTEEMNRDAKAKLTSLRGKNLSLPVKKHLRRRDSQPKVTRRQFVNAVRVASDIVPEKTNSLTWYAVPAMSEVQRLPDAYPVDGENAAPVRIVMAQDEYEPGSFVLYSFLNCRKAELKLLPFQMADGTVLSEKQLDLKVVKVWYQNGNGWYSYFGDTGLKLTPELLLNDENLIRTST